MIIVSVDIETHNKLLEGPCNLNVMTLVFFPYFLGENFEKFPKKRVTMHLKNFPRKGSQCI
jgi:hypothetical protein